MKVSFASQISQIGKHSKQQAESSLKVFRCAPDYILRKPKLRVVLMEILKGIITEVILP